jgi:hypothetical protein
MRVWSTHRPVSIGTYPREYGVKEIHNFNRREWVEEIHNYAFGYIDYEQDLPKEEQEHFDLRPAKVVNKELEQAARAMAQALLKSDMSKISKILEKAYDMGLIDDDEQLVSVAQKYM